MEISPLLSPPQTGDKLAPAEFDGDGKNDLAVHRPSSGDWIIRRSSDLQTVTVNFGADEDIPVPADFDGDGKADVNKRNKALNSADCPDPANQSSTNTARKSKR